MLAPVLSARSRALVWTAAITGALLAPLPQLPAGAAPLGTPGVDRLVHVALFFGLARAWRGVVAHRGRGAALAVAAAVTAWGGVIELAQGFTGRSAEWGDLAADALGAALALWVRP
jgi:VanZ family protein